VDSVKNDMAK